MKSAAGKLLAVLIPVALLALASWAFLTPSHTRTTARARTTMLAPVAVKPLRTSGFRWGVSVGAPMEPQLNAFDAAVGADPDIVSSYQRFAVPLNLHQLRFIQGKGATPLLQWNPTKANLTTIADGGYDGYLRSSAQTIRALRLKVIISFGHEMNGPWWPWGEGRQSPAAFVAAWRHIVSVFRGQGTKNVTWLWNPNVVSNSAVADPVAWWPGSAYVDWTGLDGYFWRPTQTFGALFKPGIAELRKLAPGKPVIIAETGAYPGPGMASRIGGLFSGAKTEGLTAVVYFDRDGHEDWRVEHDGLARAAFRSAVAKSLGS